MRALVTLLPQDGKTALDHAKEHGRNDVAHLIEVQFVKLCLRVYHLRRYLYLPFLTRSHHSLFFGVIRWLFITLFHEPVTCFRRGDVMNLLPVVQEWPH
jgi:hypothetical protein